MEALQEYIQNSSAQKSFYVLTQICNLDRIDKNLI